MRRRNLHVPLRLIVSGLAWKKSLIAAGNPRALLCVLRELRVGTACSKILACAQHAPRHQSMATISRHTTRKDSLCWPAGRGRPRFIDFSDFNGISMGTICSPVENSGSHPTPCTQIFFRKSKWNCGSEAVAKRGLTDENFAPASNPGKPISNAAFSVWITLTAAAEIGRN